MKAETPMDLQVVEHRSILSLREQWKGVEAADFPFTDFDFLAALESSHSTGERTGWFPKYICTYDGNLLVSCLILYEKNNSYGEYIFDWEWANAYGQYGLNYYPKLVSAIPFTPATGSKFLLRDGYDKNQCFRSRWNT